MRHESYLVAGASARKAETSVVLQEDTSAYETHLPALQRRSVGGRPRGVGLGPEDGAGKMTMLGQDHGGMQAICSSSTTQRPGAPHLLPGSEVFPAMLLSLNPNLPW